jgi:hypothetical protein
MLITRTSPITGRQNTLDLDISTDSLLKWQSGLLLVQEAFPVLTADEREFLISGCTKEDWETLYGAEEEE